MVFGMSVPMVLILDGSSEHLNQVFRFVKGIRCYRQSHRKRPISFHTCAIYSELPSYISTMELFKLVAKHNFTRTNFCKYLSRVDCSRPLSIVTRSTPCCSPVYLQTFGKHFVVGPTYTALLGKPQKNVPPLMVKP